MAPSINPPAHVQPAANQDKKHAALIGRIRSIDQDIERDDKLNLERAVEQGKLLIELKETCEHGEWLTELEKTGVAQQRASERTRIAKLPPAVLSQCSSIADAKLRIGSEPQDDSQPTTSTKPPANFKSVLCARHQAIGPSKAPCANCDEARRLARGGKPREPGDDAESEAEAKKKQREAARRNGQEKFTWAKVEKPYGDFVRALDLAAEHYHAKAAIARIHAIFREAFKSLEQTMKELRKS